MIFVLFISIIDTFRKLHSAELCVECVRRKYDAEGHLTKKEI